MDGLEELCKHVGARGPGFRSTQHPRPISPARLAHAPRLPRRRQSTVGHDCTAPVPAWRPRGGSSPRAPPSFPAAEGEAAAPDPLQEKRTKEPASLTRARGAPHPAGSETCKRALLGCCVRKEHQPSTPTSLRKKLSADFLLPSCAPDECCKSGITDRCPSESSAPPSAHARATAGPRPKEEGKGFCFVPDPVLLCPL